MPAIAQRLSSTLQGYDSIQKMDTSPGTPPTETYPAQPNMYSRATVPQVGNASSDSLRQYFNGGKNPQYRIPVLNAFGSPF